MAYAIGVYSDAVRARAARIVLTSATPRLAAERVVLYPGLGKRLFDLAFVVMIALPVLLVLGILALLVATDGHSPFYVQKRLGRHGKVFRMFKLRSMVPNADEVMAFYLDSNPEARVEWDRDQKLKNDPRITAVGRLIRKTSLDELPQFFNVLKGDMSVVGPRPISRASCGPLVSYCAPRGIEKDTCWRTLSGYRAECGHISARCAD